MTTLQQLKQDFNSQLNDEIQSTLNDINKNYDIGLINLHEAFKQKKELFNYAFKNVFNIKE